MSGRSGWKSDFYRRLLQQGKPKAPFKAPSKGFFGLMLSAPMTEVPVKVELAGLKLLTRSDLHIFPDEATGLWFVGRLFLDERERAMWVAGLPEKEHLLPKEFTMKPTRKSE